MNTSLYLGKSYLAGDGDNTIGALETHPADPSITYSDKTYGGDPISLLILIPVSLNKAYIDHRLTQDGGTSLVSLAMHRHSTSVSTTWSYRFAVSSVKMNINSSEFNGLMGNQTFGEAAYPTVSINIGSIVKYYDIDKGCWIYETVCRKEIKGYKKGNATTIDDSRPYEIIIGTKLKPELMKIEKKTEDSTTPIITVDLKTGNENNIILE